jgi:hypothetical protein
VSRAAPTDAGDALEVVAFFCHRGPPCEQKHSSGWTTSAGVDQPIRQRAPPARVKGSGRC